MNIQIVHSREHDFVSELYEPLKRSDVRERHNFLLPHENNESWLDSYKTIQTMDLLIAEVSYPSLWLWMELARAFHFAIPVLCLHKAWMKPSSSVSYVTSNIQSYKDPKQMMDLIGSHLQTFTMDG